MIFMRRWARAIAIASSLLLATLPLASFAQDSGSGSSSGGAGASGSSSGGSSGSGQPAAGQGGAGQITGTIGKAQDAMCPDSKALSGKLFTDICWDCQWPLYVAGVQVGKKGRFTPWGFKPISQCSCANSTNPATPFVGYGEQMWTPVRIFETTKLSYCSPLFGGAMLSDKVASLLGGTGGAGSNAHTFYNVHEYAFPLDEILQLLPQGFCHQEYSDIDIIEMSELHPDHSDDELALALNFLTVVFANPATDLFAIGEGIATSASFGAIPPVDGVLTAGSWGEMLPFTGNFDSINRPAQNSNLIALRFLAKLHWMGLERRTAGSDAMCTAQYNPMIKKSQYRWSQLYPVPEAKGWHWSGESAFNWGEFRQVPVTGEDFLWVLWRWDDCCVTQGTSGGNSGG